MTSTAGSSRMRSSSPEPAARGKLCGVGGARNSSRELTGGAVKDTQRGTAAHGVYLFEEYCPPYLRARRTLWDRACVSAVKIVFERAILSEE